TKSAMGQKPTLNSATPLSAKGQEPTLLRKLQSLPIILWNGDGTASSSSPPAPEHFAIAANANEICGSFDGLAHNEHYCGIRPSSFHHRNKQKPRGKS